MRRLKTVRRPPIYPKTPGHLPCSSLTHPLPLSSPRPSVSFGGFGLKIDSVDEDQRFEPDVELALFRVTQEATNNVVKDFKGTAIDVSLSRENGTLHLQVTDDGQGFSYSVRGDIGTGISGMRERIVQLNGTFEVVSAPKAGTTVAASIPVS